MEETTTAMVRRDDTEAYLTLEDVKELAARIDEAFKDVMVEGVHYGKTPGMPGSKPALFKPGAEKIQKLCKLAGTPYIEEKVDTPEEFSVIIKYKLVHIPTGAYVGSGYGAASSIEEKYSHRQAVCDQEFDEAPDEQKRIRYKSVYGKNTRVKQIRVPPKANLNTIIKMAKKRAQIDAVLSATAASDIFNQPAEDFDYTAPRGVPARDGRPGRPTVQEMEKGRRTVEALLVTKYKEIPRAFAMAHIERKYGAPFGELSLIKLREVYADLKDVEASTLKLAYLTREDDDPAPSFGNPETDLPPGAEDPEDPDEVGEEDFANYST